MAQIKVSKKKLTKAEKEKNRKRAEARRKAKKADTFAHRFFKKTGG